MISSPFLKIPKYALSKDQLLLRLMSYLRMSFSFAL